MKLRPTLFGLVAIAAVGAGLAGCAEDAGIAQYGTATSVAVRYYGDLANAMLAARQHCAQYGRTPEYIGTADHLAQFDCVSH